MLSQCKMEMTNSDDSPNNFAQKAVISSLKTLEYILIKQHSIS